MKLSFGSFKSVLLSFRTFKEDNADDGPATLSLNQIKAIQSKYSDIDSKIVEQAITVRKFNESHVCKLLDGYKDFRQKNDWPMRLSPEVLNVKVMKSGAHEASKCPETGMPMLIMNCAQVKPDVAYGIDFQQHAQWLLEEMTIADKTCHERGIALEVNFKDFTFADLRQFTVDDMSRGVGIFRNFPVKVKRLYISNASTTVKVGIRTVLMLTSKAVRSKVFFVNNSK
mmetsp:Transcript_17058/g.31364  ORF Transcript_17058/g.31364 Transcript_17058/m.31364 type:complete len:227 (+) Transcript_17058:273-953(+)